MNPTNATWANRNIKINHYLSVLMGKNKGSNWMYWKCTVLNSLRAFYKNTPFPSLPSPTRFTWSTHERKTTFHPSHLHLDAPFSHRLHRAYSGSVVAKVRGCHNRPLLLVMDVVMLFFLTHMLWGGGMITNSDWNFLYFCQTVNNWNLL